MVKESTQPPAESKADDIIDVFLKKDVDALKRKAMKAETEEELDDIADAIDRKVEEYWESKHSAGIGGEVNYPPVKLGDMVRVKNGEYRGEIAGIIEIYNDGYVRVKGKDREGNDYGWDLHRSRIELIKK